MTEDHTPAAEGHWEAELEHTRVANQNRSDLISMSAHELRTVLSGLRWSIDILLDEDLGSLTDGQHALLTRMSTSNDRMRGIVDDMLTLSHSDGSNISYSFQPTDVVELVGEIVFDFSKEAQSRGVQILLTKPVEPIMVEADKLKLRGAIQNLIENAIKYSTQGHDVRVVLSSTDTHMVLSVTDNGIGIPAEQQGHVFDKFFRATNAVKKEEAGYGIGLFSVKYIIEKHKGTISFESEEGKGTTFTVSIPLQKS